MAPRCHVVALPHTSGAAAYSACAYTQKHVKWLNMMSARGWELFSYGGPECDAECVEHIPCVDSVPPPDAPTPAFDASSPLFASFNRRAIRAISERIEPTDFICLIGGMAQAPVAQAFRAYQVVEYGIGYGGVIPTTHHVYESYAWMHTVYGARAGDPHGADGRFFDCVIPNYFDVADFPLGAGDGGYLLYIGRLIERKGVQIALDVAERTGLPLKVAGAGDFPLPEWVDYHGVVSPQERAALMGGAIAQLTPTTYVEPFGGVVCEAQLCGTPTITTDWGAFTETVQPGVNGFRCHTLGEFVTAVKQAPRLNRQAIHEQARATYSLESVAPQYGRYFARLSTLWSRGWYE